MSKTKLAPYSVSPVLQKLFIGSAVLVFALPFAFQVYMAVEQYARNPNLSSYYWLILYTLIAPILFFKIAYLLSDKKKAALSRVFAATLLATMGMMILTTISSLADRLIVSTIHALSGDFNAWIMFELALTSAVVGLYTLLLLGLRRKSSF